MASGITWPQPPKIQPLPRVFFGGRLTPIIPIHSPGTVSSVTVGSKAALVFAGGSTPPTIYSNISVLRLIRYGRRSATKFKIIPEVGSQAVHSVWTRVLGQRFLGDELGFRMKVIAPAK